MTLRPISFQRLFLLILLAACMSPLCAQLPTAGLAVDSVGVGNSTNPGDIEVYLQNLATGNPTSVTYIVHSPGNIQLAYNSITLFPAATPTVRFTPGNAIQCLNYEISQVASNASGSDTATVAFQAGCPCFNMPNQYIAQVQHLGSGLIVILAASNENSPNRIILPPWCNGQLPTVCTDTVPAPGDYVFCAEYSNGTCTVPGISVCDTVTISCLGPPTADFSWTLNQVSGTFTNQSSSWPAVNYHWDFGDGSTATVANPQHIFASSGVFPVCLTVTDSCGTSTFCDSVQVAVVSLEAAVMDAMVTHFQPAANRIVLDFQAALTEPGQVRVLDLQGRSVLVEKLPAGVAGKEVNFRAARGIYLLEVRIGEVLHREKYFWRGN